MEPQLDMTLKRIDDDNDNQSFLSSQRDEEEKETISDYKNPLKRQNKANGIIVLIKLIEYFTCIKMEQER